MPAFRAISQRSLVAGLRAAGFTGPYPGGRHLFMRREGLILTIPNPHSGEIGVGLLARILRQAGLSREQWEALP